MKWTIEKGNGLYLPEIGWHLDASKPVQRSFASHAHFDHLAKHESILCTPATAHFGKTRLGGHREWIIHEFEEPFEIAPGVTAKLYPAGHILGSAMLWMEKDGTTFLYTGDFKLSHSILAEHCVVPKADILLTETTFGNPRYVFPNAKDVVNDIATFCQDTLANGDTPALFTYSLGKCQEVLKGLHGSDLKIMLHPKAYEMTQICALACGVDFPHYTSLDTDAIDGHVLIGPPPQGHSQWTGGIKSLKTAMISGWAIDSSATYRYRCDKAFPLSDHSDYLDLKAFVSKVDPQFVYTTHGFAKEFASDLRESGYQAFELGQENQLSFQIEPPQATPKSSDAKSQPVPSTENLAVNAFDRFAQVAQTISQTDKLQKKTELIQDYLSSLDTDDRALAALYLIGRTTPKSSETNIAFDSTTIKQTVLGIAGKTETDYKVRKQEFANLDQTLASFLQEIGNTSSRTLSEIANFLSNLAAAPNPIFKQSFLAEELKKVSPPSGLALLRILRNSEDDQTIENCVEQALANLTNCSVGEIRQAHLRSGDLSKVASAQTSNALDTATIKPFYPLASMRVDVCSSAASIFEELSDTVWVEDKYDGVRCQIHKSGERVEIYNNDGNTMTFQFPEIVEAVRQVPQDFIGDGELIPWQDERPLPATELQKRLTRHGEDFFLGEEIPVIFWLFDLLWLNGRSLLDSPLSNRKEGLSEFTVNATIRIAPVTPISDPQELVIAHQKALGRSNAGVVAKSPNSPYILGETSKNWLTFTPAETLF